MLRTEKKLSFYNSGVFSLVENNVKQKPIKLSPYSLGIFGQLKTSLSTKLQ